MVAERLEVASERDHVAPGVAHPSRVCLGREGPHAPAAVRETVAHVVRELPMTGQQPQRLTWVSKDVRRLLPAQLPRAPLHEPTCETALLECEVNVVGHEHLGRVRHGDRPLEQLLETAAGPRHRLLELDVFPIEEPGLIRLDPTDLDRGARAHPLHPIPPPPPTPSPLTHSHSHPS